MKRSNVMSTLASVSGLFAAQCGIAAEPVASEPMMLDFGRGCASTEEKEMSGPGIVKPRLGPKHPPKAPKYPKEASKRGEQGTVQMLLLVNEDGHVSRARVVKSSGSIALDRASLEASGEWQLEPGRVNSQPTCMWFTFYSFWKL